MENPATRIELQVQLRVLDLYEVFVQQALWRFWFGTGAGALAIALIILIAFWKGSIEFLRPLFEPPLLYVALSLFLYSILVRPFVAARTFIKNIAGRSSAIDYVFSETGVDIRREHYEGHYDWAGIRRARQSARLLVLYTDSMWAMVLPKRCFANAQQLADCRMLINNQMQRRKTLLASHGKVK